MAWLELLMCSLRESKFTESIKLWTSVKTLTEPVELRKGDQPDKRKEKAAQGRGRKIVLAGKKTLW